MAINEFYLLKVRDFTMPNLLQYVTIKVYLTVLLHTYSISLMFFLFFVYIRFIDISVQESVLLYSKVYKRWLKYEKIIKR